MGCCKDKKNQAQTEGLGGIEQDGIEFFGETNRSDDQQVDISRRYVDNHINMVERALYQRVLKIAKVNEVDMYVADGLWRDEKVILDEYLDHLDYLKRIRKHLR